MSPPRARACCRGFTLLELLIAVAILAISMGALLAGFARYADQAAYLKLRSVATWVAHNKLTEMELEPGWPGTGSSDGETEMMGLVWKYKLDVKATDDPELRRLDVRVYAPGVAADKASSPTAAALTAFLSSAGRT